MFLFLGQFCLSFNLKAKRGKTGSYFVTWPGGMEDSPSTPSPIASHNPHSLTEAELASSHLDPELAVSLWTSHEQGGIPSQTALWFWFGFSGNAHLCLSLCILFVLWVLLNRFFFMS